MQNRDQEKEKKLQKQRLIKLYEKNEKNISFNWKNIGFWKNIGPRTLKPISVNLS